MKSLLIKLLPRKVIELLKQYQMSFQCHFMSFFSRYELTSSIYYLIFSREFGREHRAVLKGKLVYIREHTEFSSGFSSLLRRNIHRLEKGLIMQPRRDVFAEQYIQETVNAFIKLLPHPNFCQEERQWASDVLNKYFDVVNDSPKIGLAKKLFKTNVASKQANYTPYQDRQRVRASIETDELSLLYHQRRSTRWYQTKPVENEKIDRAIDMASYAPSACNRQPYSFYVANDTIKAQELANLAVGTGGFAHNLPAVIAIVGDLSAYPYEKDRHLIYIDGSLAAMQFMLALETMGLSSCPLNWPDIAIREKAITRKLNLSEHQRVVMLIALGYADSEGMIPYSQKKKSHLLRRNIK